MLKNETELMVSLYSSAVSSLAQCSSVHFGNRVLPYQTAQSMVPAKIARTGNKCHFLRSRSYRLHNVILKCREHRNWFRHFKRLSSSRRSPNQRLLSSTLAIRSNVFKCPTSNERPNFYPPNILRSPSLPTRPPFT